MGILFAVLVDYRDVSLSNAECSVSGILYDIGDDRTYIVVSLHNLGSRTITSASVTFVDDFGAEYGFNDNSLVIDPGNTWNRMDSFPASISAKKNYVIKATSIIDDGSMISCSTIYEIRS